MLQQVVAGLPVQPSLLVLLLFQAMPLPVQGAARSSVAWRPTRTILASALALDLQSPLEYTPVVSELLLSMSPSGGRLS